MMNRTLSIVSCFLIVLLAACGGSNNGTDVVLDDSTSVMDTPRDDSTTEVRIKRTQLIFHTIPSPLETANMFLKAGMTYDPALLNPIDNVSNYSTSAQQALNLGVYGADLSCASIFDQTQESMFYLNCSKKLADKLGVSSAFDEKTMERFERNINNRDSLMNLINDSYWKTDAYFQEGERENMSALIISGGWIEGLYLGTQMMESQGINDNIASKIAEQKYSYENLLDLLHTFNNDLDIDAVKSDLLKLEDIFERIKVIEGKTDIIENEDGSTTIGGGATLSYTNDDIKEIATVVKELRTKITG